MTDNQEQINQLLARLDALETVGEFKLLPNEIFEQALTKVGKENRC